MGAFMLAAISALNGTPQAAQPGMSELELTAVKYNFIPNVIKVKKGDQVKLVITARDRDHGFKLAAFHIDQRLPKGEAVTVEFTADQAGTFPFQCSVFCGLGHKKMNGQLIVE
jgi:cytochrome c oxidase subunit 2